MQSTEANEFVLIDVEPWGDVRFTDGFGYAPGSRGVRMWSDSADVIVNDSCFLASNLGTTVYCKASYPESGSPRCGGVVT